jgi:hypothetical protein
MPSAFEEAVVRHRATTLSPERLATLKNIFETVCDEVAIPADACADRDALANKILISGQSITSEMVLVLNAMHVAMGLRS